MSVCRGTSGNRYDLSQIVNDGEGAFAYWLNGDRSGFRGACMTTLQLTESDAGAQYTGRLDAWTRLLCVLFFFSGFPALIYQLTWQRALFRIFGVNIESVTVVVTAFMLGLGIGSLAGGWLSKRRGVALLPLLAAIELATGAFGLFSLAIF